MENAKNPWRPLGQMLVEKGLIGPEQLEAALEEQARTGERIGGVLVALGFVPEPTLRSVLLEQWGLDLTRQDGFGSGLLSQLERRGVGVRASELPSVSAEPVERRRAGADGDEPRAIASEPILSEPVPEARADVLEPPSMEPQTRGVLRQQREKLGASFDVLLETFDERSKALSAELAAMRRLLRELTR